MLVKFCLTCYEIPQITGRETAACRMKAIPLKSDIHLKVDRFNLLLIHPVVRELNILFIFTVCAQHNCVVTKRVNHSTKPCQLPLPPLHKTMPYPHYVRPAGITSLWARHRAAGCHAR